MSMVNIGIVIDRVIVLHLNYVMLYLIEGGIATLYISLPQHIYYVLKFLLGVEAT